MAEAFESAIDGESIDDILSQAAAFMQALGLDTDIVEEALKEEEPEEDAISDVYASVQEHEMPDYDAPVVIRKIEELDPTELAQLEDRYGNQNVGRFAEHGTVISEVRTLDKYERSIFLGEDLTSPQFNLQYLYKIESDMDRRDIQAKINEFFANNPLLRVNFLSIGLDAKMHKILFKKREPMVNFYSMRFLKGDALNNSIEKMMENDRQKPFDLAKDPLLHFICVKVGDDFYAVIVTLSRLVTEVFNEREFFYRVFGVKNPPQIPKDTAKELDYSEETAAYYHKLLKDLPPIPKIPRFERDYNHFIPRIHQAFLHPELFKILKDKSFNKRDVMIAIIATAWGLLQKQVNYNRETYFALLLSDHNLGDNAKITAGKVYPLPLRIAINDNSILKDIAGKVLRQMLTSRSLGCTKMKYILKPFGDPAELFPCYLHFHDFSKSAEEFDKAETLKSYKLLEVKSFDAGRSDLNIYFDIKKEGLAITFRYNPFCFTPRTIKPLAKYFEIAIGCLLLAYNQKFSVFEDIYQDQIKGWDRSFGSYIL